MKSIPTDSIKGKKVAQILHHQWINLSKAGEPYQFLEWMQWVFENGEQIVLQNDIDSGTLTAVELNIEAEKQLVSEQFSGKIQIKTLDVSTAAFYEGVYQNTLLNIISHPIIEDEPYPGCLLFDFGKVNILIAPSAEEGIELERFVDDAV